MKLTREVDVFYNTMCERYGHILSKYCIMKHIENSTNKNQCEIAIVKDYLIELQSIWN